MTKEKGMELLNDKVAKKIFSNSEIGRKYAAKIISEVLKIDYKYVVKELVVVHPEIGINNSIVGSISDLVYNLEEGYINVEINYSDRKDTEVKNKVYLCQLYLRNIITSKDYDKARKVVQINIDGYDYFEMGDFLYKSTLREEKYNIEEEFIEVYHINLAYLQKDEYNKVRKDELKKLLYLFVCNDDEAFNKFYGGDKFMEEIKKSARRIAESLDCLLYYDPEDLNKQYEKELREKLKEEVRDEVKKEVRDEVKKEVRDEVKKEDRIDIAKSLIKNKVDINIIISSTGLSLEEIEKLKNTI